MEALVRYGRILDRLSHEQFHKPTGLRVLFEQHNLLLSHKHYLLAMFCLLSLRPRHKGLANTLWAYIRQTDEPVKGYIFRFTQYTAIELGTSTTYEERSLAMSKATRRSKAPNFKGEILAINVKTEEEIVLIGPEEIQAAGFDPRSVYRLLSNPQRTITHRGYVFVRIKK